MTVNWESEYQTFMLMGRLYSEVYMSSFNNNYNQLWSHPDLNQVEILMKQKYNNYGK